MEALKDIPEIEEPLLTEKGPASLQKTDIFRRIMWFGYENENTWFPVDVTRVVEILALNKAGKKPATLLVDEDIAKEEKFKAISRDLERLDKKFSDKNKKGKGKGKGKNKNRKGNPNRNRNSSNKPRF
jgi:hypothetical protein